MKMVFMGTAGLSCASLEKLARGGYAQIAAVVTQPDRPRGRNLKLQPSPVKEAAQKLQLPVLQPGKARDEKFIAQLRELKPELIVVVAYGQILPRAILDLPQFGCLNVHASLLPKYRGASPIQSALLDGETGTGVTLMKMDEGLDTGPILSQQAVPILPGDNSQTLHDRLAPLGAELLVQTIPDYIAGKIAPRPQPAEGASYAPKIRKEDGRMDWREPAARCLNRLRAFTPRPGVFAAIPGPKPRLLKIWRADVVERSGGAGEILQADKHGLVVACGQGALRILELQPESGRRMNAPEFLAGHALNAGERLS